MHQTSLAVFRRTITKQCAIDAPVVVAHSTPRRNSAAVGLTWKVTCPLAAKFEAAVQSLHLPLGKSAVGALAQAAQARAAASSSSPAAGAGAVAVRWAVRQAEHLPPVTCFLSTARPA